MRDVDYLWELNRTLYETLMECKKRENLLRAGEIFERTVRAKTN